MTNLEYYQYEIKQIMNRKNEETLILNKVVGDAFNEFSLKYVNNYQHSYNKFIDWLLAEYKEPIKLTKFEYDLLKCYQETKDDGEFEDHYILKEMQYKGHFQNVDYNLTIEEILENCEVIEK